MSLDERLAAFSESLVSGEATSAADQRGLLSILAENLRDSQDQLRESQDQLRESQDHTQAMIKEIEHLHRALESRDIIGQAKGILMERYDVDAAEAFELLVKLSQTSNTALTVVAEKLVEIDHPDVKPHD